MENFACSYSNINVKIKVWEYTGLDLVAGPSFFSSFGKQIENKNRKVINSVIKKQVPMLVGCLLFLIKPF